MRKQQKRSIKPFTKRRAALDSLRLRLLQVQGLEERAMLAAYVWNGNLDSNWATAGNWAVDGNPAATQPNANDDAEFSKAGGYQVLIAGNPSNQYTVGQLNVTGASSPTFDLRGQTLTIGNPGFAVDGASTEPQVTVKDTKGNGLLATDGFDVGTDEMTEDSSAAATITGANVATTEARVGAKSDNDNYGKLALVNGTRFVATETTSIDNGALTVTGASLQSDGTLYVGMFKDPTLESQLIVGSLSPVVSNAPIQIAGAINDPKPLESIATKGTVALTGPSATLDSTKGIYVGVAGTGTLNVAEGSIARTAGALIGLSFFSTGIANISGVWSVRAPNFPPLNQIVTVNPDFSLDVPVGVNLTSAFVGESGGGTLNIDNVGQVEAGRMVIGSGAGSVGNVNLLDPESKLLIVGPMTVGQNGAGGIDDNGGFISTQANSQIAMNGGGLVKLRNDAIWYAGPPLNRSDITIGGGKGRGELHIDKATVYVGTVIIKANGILSGDGTINGKTKNMGGKIQPGENGGLRVTGDLIANGDFDATGGGTYVAESAGPNNNDLLTVADTATLGGSMVVPAIGSPDFEQGQTYTMLTAGTLSGQFTNLPATYDADSGT
jgi:T5SS/PEP-CTERM-associated repeat protein